MTDSVTIFRHGPPRDTADLARFLFAGLVLLLELGIPVALVVVAARALGWSAFGMGSGAALAVLLVAGVVISTTMVDSLVVGESGITFHRPLGRSTHYAWSDVTDIRPASPGEVIREGWLWPPLPPREPTNSWTSEGHYRVTLRSGYRFFPPAEDAEFRAALSRWAPHLL